MAGGRAGVIGEGVGRAVGKRNALDRVEASAGSRNSGLIETGAVRHCSHGHDVVLPLTAPDWKNSVGDLVAVRGFGDRNQSARVLDIAVAVSSPVVPVPVRNVRARRVGRARNGGVVGGTVQVVDRRHSVITDRNGVSGAIGRITGTALRITKRVAVAIGLLSVPPRLGACKDVRRSARVDPGPLVIRGKRALCTGLVGARVRLGARLFRVRHASRTRICRKHPASGAVWDIAGRPEIGAAAIYDLPDAAVVSQRLVVDKIAALLFRGNRDLQVDVAVVDVDDAMVDRQARAVNGCSGSVQVILGGSTEERRQRNGTQKGKGPQSHKGLELRIQIRKRSEEWSG